jgi:DNA-binding response OmpR family regulator
MEHSKMPTILVASANDAWKMSCAGRLLADGYDVHTACDGIRAIDDLRKHRYTAVVFDDTLPDVSPFELHLNVGDIAQNAPSEFIAIGGEGVSERAREQIRRNGVHIHVGTPDEILELMVPAIQHCSDGNDPS